MSRLSSDVFKRSRAAPASEGCQGAAPGRNATSWGWGGVLKFSKQNPPLGRSGGVAVHQHIDKEHIGSVKPLVDGGAVARSIAKFGPPFGLADSQQEIAPSSRTAGKRLGHENVKTKDTSLLTCARAFAGIQIGRKVGGEAGDGLRMGSGWEGGSEGGLEDGPLGWPCTLSLGTGLGEMPQRQQHQAVRERHHVLMHSPVVVGSVVANQAHSQTDQIGN